MSYEKREGNYMPRGDNVLTKQRIAAVKSLSREQLWLLAVQTSAPPRPEVEVESKAVARLLGVSGKQSEAVENITRHYVVRLAVRQISPSGVVMELINSGLTPEYATLLADVAEQTAENLRAYWSGDALLAHSRLERVLKRLTAIEQALEVKEKANQPPSKKA